MSGINEKTGSSAGRHEDDRDTAGGPGTPGGNESEEKKVDTEDGVDKNGGRESNGSEDKEKPQTVSENETVQPGAGSKKSSVKTGEKKVILHAEAYKSIILYATRYANNYIPRHKWSEIYGILIGYIDRDKNAVIVEKAQPMTHGASTDVQLDARHYAFIAEIQDKLDAEGKGRFMVGWFHSHPGLSLFYSYTDIVNHMSFQQANPDFIGIVFDHTYIFPNPEIPPPPYESHPGPFNPDYIITEDHPNHPKNTGIVCYRLNDPFMDPGDPMFDNNYHDVEYEIIGLNPGFFARILTEISTLYAAGKPFETAYGEEQFEPIPESGQPLTQTSRNTATVKENISAPSPPAADSRSAPIGVIKKVERPPVGDISELTPLGGDLSEIPGVIPGRTIGEPKGPTIPHPVFGTGDKDRAEGRDNIKDKSDTTKRDESPSGDIKALIKEGKLKIKFDNNAVEADYFFDKAVNRIIELEKNSEGSQKILYSEKLLSTLSEITEEFIGGNFTKAALNYAERLKKEAEERGSLLYMGNADFLKGKIYYMRGEFDRSLELFQNASVFYSKCEDFAGMGIAEENIGNIYNEHGDTEKAIQFWAEALKNYRTALKGIPMTNERWRTKSGLKSKIKTLEMLIEENLDKIGDPEIKNRVSEILNKKN